MIITGKTFDSFCNCGINPISVGGGGIGCPPCSFLVINPLNVN